jgi:hypothetical protein
MNESIRRQDASAHMPLGVFRNGELVAVIEDPAGDPSGTATRDLWAAHNEVSPFELEVFVLCHLHPLSSAVDCLDCEPLEN